MQSRIVWALLLCATIKHNFDHYGGITHPNWDTKSKFGLSSEYLWSSRPNTDISSKFEKSSTKDKFEGKDFRALKPKFVYDMLCVTHFPVDYHSINKKLDVIYKFEQGLSGLDFPCQFKSSLSSSYKFKHLYINVTISIVWQ